MGAKTGGQKVLISVGGGNIILVNRKHDQEVYG